MIPENPMDINSWQQVVALIGAIAWVVRLESKAKQNANDIERNNKLAWKSIDKLYLSDKKNAENIANLKGVLSNKDKN